MRSVLPYVFLLLLCCCLRVLQCSADLPSTCLHTLTTSDSVQCCKASPFLEISFRLRFGCDVPTTLEKGVRLEISTKQINWQPIRFYTPSVVETNNSIVRHIGDGMVAAQALQYSSNFSLEVVEGNQPIFFREYICDPSFMVDGVSVRWMQRFGTMSELGNSTWSLDDVTLTVWNGVCRYEVLKNTFDNELPSENYREQASNVTTLTCDPTKNSQLYFTKPNFQTATSRRSLTIPGLSLSNTTQFCTADTVTGGAGSCDISECNNASRSVCSIGAVQCDSCFVSGYSPPAEGTVGLCSDINECSSPENNTCEQVCNNTEGSYHCACNRGFTLLSNGQCQDIDECSQTPNVCDQRCNKAVLNINECSDSALNNCTQSCDNTEGSYQCLCNDGFVLLSNGFQCEDVDECIQTPSVCDQLCSNSIGSFQCNCTIGYVLDSNLKTCTDVNECLAFDHGCEHMCNNSDGSFDCMCYNGYILEANGMNCSDINECEMSDINICEDICINTNGSYQCSCAEGFTLVANGFNSECQDIDECNTTSLNNCSELCVNTLGSFTCSCPAGFVISADNVSCQDIDECDLKIHECAQLCNNTAGSYECSCQPGFVSLSNGSVCEDIDECNTTSLNNCSELCVNIPGSFTCSSCPAGFVIYTDNGSCQDIQSLAMQELQNLRSRLLSGDINTAEIAAILARRVSLLIEMNVLASRDLSMLVGEVVDLVLTNVDTRGGENQVDQEAVSSVLDTLDQFALHVYDERVPELETNGFRLQVINADRNTEGFDGISVGDNKITLPNLGDTVKVASFFFNDLSQALPRSPDITSDNFPVERAPLPVISSSVLCDNCDVSELQQPVRYQLNVTISKPYTQGRVSSVLFDGSANLWLDDTNKNLSCFFYDLLSDDWSGNGCMLVEDASTETVTVCECNHLTHFGILLSPGLNLTKQQTLELTIASYVCVSISLVSLMITILALTVVKSLWGMRNFIHVNLCVSLFIAQLLFVVTVGMTEPPILCQSIAVVLHYAFLVTFMWMLMEGVVLYVVLVQVFVKKPKVYMALFTLVSYGAPLLYLCITVPLGFVLRGDDGEPHYGYDQACWLRSDTHFVWAFIAPVIVIILINIGFFIMAVYIMRKHTKRQTQRSRITSVTQWLKSSIVLLISMGIPWIVGIVIFSENEIAFQLAFVYTIFIGLQGFIIFLLFVPLSKQVKEGYKKWWRGKVSESEFLSKHFSSFETERKSSFLGRLSSIRGSLSRSTKSHHSTYASSHSDHQSEIKLPVRGDTQSPSQSPPPGYEEYVVQKVVNVRNDKPHQNGNGEYLAPHENESCVDDNDGHLEAGKVDLSLQIEESSTVRGSMIEEQKIRFTDSVPDVRYHHVEGTSL